MAEMPAAAAAAAASSVEGVSAGAEAASAPVPAGNQKYLYLLTAGRCLQAGWHLIKAW